MFETDIIFFKGISGFETDIIFSKELLVSKRDNISEGFRISKRYTKMDFKDISGVLKRHNTSRFQDFKKS